MKKTFESNNAMVVKTIYTTYRVTMDTVDDDLQIISVKPIEHWDTDPVINLPNNKYSIEYWDLFANLCVTVETSDIRAKLEKVELLHTTISDCEHCINPAINITSCPTCPRLPAAGTCNVEREYI